MEIIMKQEPMYGSKKKKISSTILIVGILIIALFLFFFLSTKFLSITQKENYEYRWVTKNEHIYGKVLRVYQDKGVTFITLSDSLKICLPYSENYGYKSPYLNFFIEKGDLLEKKPKYDTLIIYRDSNQYFFVLGKFINQPQSSHSNE
jgi:cell division protein FtsI/penicillin-binding protein 2